MKYYLTPYEESLETLCRQVENVEVWRAEDDQPMNFGFQSLATRRGGYTTFEN
jgi:hypothetical protein